MTTQLTEAHLDCALAYHNTRGLAQCKPFYGLLAHFFNHQTHHRGQAHMILTGLGRSAPELDLLYYQREVEAVRPRRGCITGSIPCSTSTGGLRASVPCSHA